MTQPRFSRGQRRRAVLSSYLGSMIEYYDFLLYATASAVVFNQVFFSDLDPLVGTVAAFGTLAAGYIARPIGGIVFGHFGDRVGRKKMLVISMVMMGVASTLIGLLPTYDQVGALAPILLVFLRIVQGIAVGGEWGGAVLMSAEHASSRRGLWASFTNAGAPSGMVLSTVVLALFAAISGPEGFLVWGWRIPFILSVVLLAIGLFVRLSVTETPVFAAAAANKPARPPLLEVLRNHPRNLALAVGIGFGAFIAQGTLTTFLISYAVQAGFERQTVLNALTLSSVVAIGGIIGFSALSDVVGRRPVVLGGALATGAWCFAVFPMVDTGSAVLLTIAVVVGQGITHAAWFGPSAALYSELFSTGSRYTGASIGYQLSGLGAGLAPVTFASIMAAGAGPGTISVVIGVFALVSVGSVLVLSETSRGGLADTRDAEPDGDTESGRAGSAGGTSRP
ncbi:MULTISPECIES: MFS transporter [Pseudonocardia]|uniref:Inner membrane metabolite transport protein YhjE n=2 Tax=Pseudonocardia TaxID=1847 RepID=A0A1Y2MVK1_PSEAH|nr:MULTISPECIES: MFS transporter [Pseudonocardia]OSY39224.1 Inner membrane metabolite transport protein YhjE [Pseudonocardia autotrophica]TDN76554.1 MFS transporter [Pseudonocardia autotrophica]BBG00554.1 MFS transporter [Pseudonocardia autotrophica]GEC28456.1 MFS transporter [Pseudonocardia saturnea]